MNNAKEKRAGTEALTGDVVADLDPVRVWVAGLGGRRCGGSEQRTGAHDRGRRLVCGACAGLTCEGCERVRRPEESVSRRVARRLRAWRGARKRRQRTAHRVGVRVWFPGVAAVPAGALQVTAWLGTW